MGTAAQFRNERGQALSSVVAVAAVVAVVIGLLVLFGTGGPGGSGDDGGSAGAGTPSGSTTTTTSSVPVTTAPPSTTTVTPPPVSTVSTPPPVTATTTKTVPQPTKTVTKTAPPVRVTTRPRPNLGPRPSVEIYNNTTEKGLADRTSSRARNAGWTVSGIDNWIGRVATTTVYYPLGMYGQAGRLGGDLGISSLKPALSNMKKDRLTVILTTDYRG